MVVVLDKLVAALQAQCATFPDRRTGDNSSDPMADFGMAAFATFFMQSPSFLAQQTALARGRGTSDCQTLFAMHKTPTDNHIRTMLDPVPPETLFPMFDATLAALENGGGLAAFRRLGDHVLIALDGTEYFCSQKLSCPNCSTRLRANGKTEHFHAMVARKLASKVSAALVAPGNDRASWRSHASHGRRWSLSSSCPRTVARKLASEAPTSKTARPERRTAGWQPMGPSMHA